MSVFSAARTSIIKIKNEHLDLNEINRRDRVDPSVSKQMPTRVSELPPALSILYCLPNNSMEAMR